MVLDDMSSIDKQPEEDSLSEDDEEQDSIRLLATKCNDLFDSSLARTAGSDRALPPLALRFFGDYKRRFQGWCWFMCVITEHENESLDYRLRNDAWLHDVIMRYLDILLDNLLFVDRSQLQGNDYDSCNNETELPSVLQVGFTGIRESVDRLNKLGVNRMTSSRSIFVASARRFATQHPDLVRLSDFELRAYIAVYNLYPSAPESLRQQLSDSMTDRYAKLCYEANITRRFQPPSSSKVESRQQQNDKDDVQPNE
ncbi:hypothetical protein BU24DRAFT_459936 [Aaosphaeria arxii CBS 175.79]|uniref:Uncharacterized protein n=1 Tax=Aaosphaeria arxii CBS 175.79 TaxID=1450172 RepID=A0A6A5XW02_9PLEO|nr:uncharacterized protein BU24DRAFT_459936 [Aaosphaeria arxii CBS 175.79]KAF2016810.1 hypothetical protein BU24DRAFT_459936 [Aaosphaeria arxii CBS 175.79]